jgi:serine/threonine protein kinase
MSTKQGYLHKQGRGVLKSWKKYWFSIEGSLLKYSEKAGKKEKASVELSKVSQVQPIAEGKRFAFRVVTPGKTFTLAAESAASCQAWMDALQPKQAKAQAPGACPAATGHHPSLDDYTMIKLIGKGSYGAVHLVRSKLDHHLYAMKLMDKRVLQEGDQVSQTIIERDVLFKIRHPFTVAAHATFQSHDTIYMILDYVPGGELFGRLKAEGKFSQRRVRLYAAELALAIGHLHANGYIYRDLKPENVLVDEGGHLRITDFGLVKSKMKDAAATTGTFCGTPEYIAPEMLQRLPYTRAVDWWSLGILVFEMVAGIPPFYDENTNRMYRKILQEDITFPADFSPGLRGLIGRLLDRNPATRLGAGDQDVEDVKTHPFFEGLSWDGVYKKEIAPEWVPRIASDTDTTFFNEDDLEDAQPDVSGTVLQAATQEEFKGFTFTDEGPL